MKWCYAKWIALVLLVIGWFISINNAASSQEVEEVAPVPESSSAAQYQNCITTVNTEPQLSFDVGTEWRDEGGGLPAQHCVAMALVGLGLYEDAAEQLEVVASELSSGKGSGFATMLERSKAEVLIDVYLQAGNVWLLAERSVMAYDALSFALLEMEPDNEQMVELYVDRARASGFGGDYQLALDDLTKANEMSPEREDVLVYMAVAQRSLEKFSEAEQTLTDALSIFPDNPEVLLEVGNLRFDMGDVDAARLSWVQLVARHPETYAANVARSNIEKLDALEEEGHIILLEQDN